MASSGSALFPHLVRRLILHTRPQVHRRAKSECEGQDVVFDTTLLDYIVCPVSKKPLRYDASSKELVNEELSIAYPVVNGIPQLMSRNGKDYEAR
uniref:Protein preY, mitochondrial n=1 Tax=Eptatretus burgeri TaxID=7764 RepID=A0A8C4X1D2_EPTBU